MNAFTVDLEEWYQGLTSTNPQVQRWPEFESRAVLATERVLGVLAFCGVRATFFVLGYLADRQPDLVTRIRAAGHEIALHGYHHRFVSRLTPHEFERELVLGVHALERITGERPIGHRAPYFSVNAGTSWALDLLEAHGFEYDSSLFPARTMLYGDPDAPRFPYRPVGHKIMEFPLSTVRLGGVNWPMAGGFYLRVLPASFVCWSIARLNRQGHPAILYMHPWELDTGQKYSKVSLRERVTHYYGRRHLEKKLRFLLSSFRFATLGEFDGSALDSKNCVSEGLSCSPSRS